MSLNQSVSTSYGSLSTFQCLYNAASSSCSNFCLNCKFDALTVKLGILNVVSSILLVFGALQSSESP